MRKQISHVAVVWLVLVAATVASWSERTTVTTAGAAVILALTAGKVMLVIGSYMEVAKAPRWLVLACGFWTTAVFGGLAVLYLG
ncbi:hypothetical protein [Nocardia neocaledoniensis]|uniref:hypothetical protein n=1 Tax=Nocardia neocaledoniensis TaxID=236511 RepID=UPI002454D107|nr:hypothetical protein [Nocardia neocaledoniensis]